MLTALSVIFIIWALFTNFILAMGAGIPIPFTTREQRSLIVLGNPVRMWYLLISHLSGIAGAIYIYVTHF